MIEVKGFYIKDMGSPNEGLPEASYELTGDFNFEYESGLKYFRDGLHNLMYENSVGEVQVFTFEEIEKMNKELSK